MIHIAKNCQSIHVKWHLVNAWHIKWRQNVISHLYDDRKKSVQKSRGIFRFHRCYHTLFTGSSFSLFLSFNTFVIFSSSTLVITTFWAFFMAWMDALKSIQKHLGIALQRKEMLDRIKANCFFFLWKSTKKYSRCIYHKRKWRMVKKEQKRIEILCFMVFSIHLWC